eukprot:gene29653-35795_t
MDDEEVLDEAEQNKIIEDLTSQAAQLSSSTRNSNNPWSMEHQRHFREVVPHSLFLTYYAASSFCFAIAAVVVQDRPPTLPITLCRYLAILVSVVVLLGWGSIFYAQGVSNPLLFWIPVVDLAGLALAYFIHLDTKGIVVSVDNLQNLKYAHKSA